MRRPGIEPSARIFDSDSSTDLQALRIGRQSFGSGRIVARPELDHVPPGERIGAVPCRKPGGGVIGDKIFSRGGTIVAQGAADDLLHFPVVQVNTGAKERHRARLSVRSVMSGPPARGRSAIVRIRQYSRIGIWYKGNGRRDALRQVSSPR